MAQPSYSGVQIFGVPGACYSRVRANPPRAQWNAFNGVDGRERLRLGADGRSVQFAWLAAFTDEAECGAYELAMLALHAAGGAAVLVDTLGAAHAGAVLEEFEPTEEVEPDGFGGCTRTYHARFEVL